MFFLDVMTSVEPFPVVLQPEYSNLAFNIAINTEMDLIAEKIFWLKAVNFLQAFIDFVICSHCAGLSFHTEMSNNTEQKNHEFDMTHALSILKSLLKISTSKWIALYKK